MIGVGAAQGAQGRDGDEQVTDVERAQSKQGRPRIVGHGDPYPPHPHPTHGRATVARRSAELIVRPLVPAPKPVSRRTISAQAAGRTLPAATLGMHPR